MRGEVRRRRVAPHREITASTWSSVRSRSQAWTDRVAAAGPGDRPAGSAQDDAGPVVQGAVGRVRARRGRSVWLSSTMATQDVPCRRSRARSSDGRVVEGPDDRDEQAAALAGPGQADRPPRAPTGCRARARPAGPAAGRRRHRPGRSRRAAAARRSAGRRSRARPGGGPPTRPRSRPTPARTPAPRRGGRPCAGRAGCWPGSARAAPRGAPSARRAGRSSASGPGAGRRRGGTPGSRRRPRRRRPPRAVGCRRDRPSRRARAGRAARAPVGVTISWSRAVNERACSTSPNGSLSRTASGPTVNRPRTSERTE